METPRKTHVDQLGRIKARIAALIAEEDKLKKLLIRHYRATGVASFNGRMYDATVSDFTRESLDLDAVRAKLSKRFIALHTTSTPVYTVRVTARKR